MLIKLDSRVSIIKHVLKFLHNCVVQSGGKWNLHVVIKSHGRVIDIKLRPSRGIILSWQKRSSSMNEFSMKPIGLRPSTIVVPFINISPNRSKSQKVVIMADIFAKGCLNWCLKGEKIVKLRRRMVKIGGHDFALITAHAKPGLSFGRLREMLIQPMKGMTGVTDYNHGF